MKLKIILLLTVFLVGILLSGCNDSDTASSETPSEPKTEISTSGFGTMILITPSKDNTISGVVTITATKVPSETGVVGFSISGGNVPEDSSFTNIALDRASNDGWTTSFDTTEYDNGAYEITIVAGSADFQRMLGSATAGVVIQN